MDLSPTVGSERGGRQSLHVAEIGNSQLVPAEANSDRLLDSHVPDQHGFSLYHCLSFVKNPVLSSDLKPGQRAVVE